jgi:hypothetical protein
MGSIDRAAELSPPGIKHELCFISDAALLKEAGLICDFLPRISSDLGKKSYGATHGERSWKSNGLGQKMQILAVQSG